MENQIHVTLKDVYGKAKAYPANEQAKRLAMLVGNKTLTFVTLAQASTMGFRIMRDIPGRGVADITPNEMDSIA